MNIISADFFFMHVKFAKKSLTDVIIFIPENVTLRGLPGVKDVGEILWHADSPKQTAIEYAEEG